MREMGMIPEIQKTIRMTTAFGGYNHREIISDGECYDMQNMSGDMYPSLCSRKKRGITEYTEDLNGIAGRSELVLIRGTDVYYGGVRTGLTVSADEGMLPKRIVSMGAYVCIWPDKVFFNTHDFTDQGNMERYWYANDYITQTGQPSQPYAEAPVIQLCKGDGTNYDMTTVTTAGTAPKNPADGKLWIDTSGAADVLRQYSSDRKEWTEVPTVYLKISAPDIGKGLQQYDCVTLSSLEYEKYWTGAPDISDRVKQQLKDLNGSNIVYFSGDNYIVIAGMLRQTVNLFFTLRADRITPDLDYMCESNNRIWGCKYGKNKITKVVCKSKSMNNVINLCDLEGNVYRQGNGTLAVGETPPEEPSDGMRWIDNSGDEDVLYKYDAGDAEWKTETPYVFLIIDDYKNMGDSFEVGDTVEINGIIGYMNDFSMTTTDKQRAQAQALNGKHTVVGKATSSDNKKGIILQGIVEDTMNMVNWRNASSNEDYVLVQNVTADDGEFVNEIRACALGDFKNWNKFMGLSTDSYAASVGTDGEFTGCGTQQGYPVFFKEQCIHRLYGTAPNSFQINTIMCRGVQKGSGRSVAVVNETILYKSMTDVMYYDGNMPQSVSSQLGDVLYEDARAGAVNGKYYISMRHGEDWSLFCYDTRKGIWMREDGTRALGFGTVGDELYYIDEKNNTLVTVNGTDGTAEVGPVEWSAEFGISGIEYTPTANGKMARADMHDHLYLSRFDMRLKMEEDTEADLWIQYDSDGYWENKGKVTGKRLQIFVLPVIPRRCDHLRVKITGKGTFRILSLSRVMEVGSDG